MAGYSSKSLAEKLGIRPGHTIIIIGAPPGYRSGLQLPPNVAVMEELRGMFDVIHLFTPTKKELQRQFPKLAKHLVANGMLWVSWPKKSSKAATDLDENVVRDVGLGNKLVDVKVAAIDDVWSGLKFVYRLKDR